MNEFRFVACSNCQGSGVIVVGAWVFEHGCGFGHSDTDEHPCPDCDGAGEVEVFVQSIDIDDLALFAGNRDTA